MLTLRFNANYMKKIKSALISVYYKDGLEELIKELSLNGVTIYSTGGTQTFIEQLGVGCTSVESLTSYPSILGGRVKTLHPKVFGGILARRDNRGDVEQLSEYQIPEIDLVIVDLYPFEQTVSSGAAEQEVIEKIDIGGISLIRAAAKNFKDVTIVSAKEQYQWLVDMLRSQGGCTNMEQRRMFAGKAFEVSSHYDTAIANYFAAKTLPLRYGENPHQQAVFYGDFDAMFDKLNGKEVSYNNLLDIDAAVNLIEDFADQPTFAILKHNNACGLAQRDTLEQAWDDALSSDPVSAFGGVLICNRTLNEATATKINSLFFEVLIAPDFAGQALNILKSKKNRIILKSKDLSRGNKSMRTLLNGVMEQERDTKVGGVDSECACVTKVQPTKAELEDMIFANKIVKHSKSNAIVLAHSGMLIASGVGQTSRVDSLRQAIAKARSFGFSMQGAAMASDAFFPFADCAEIAHQAGVMTIIQPGGSIHDQDTIDYCNANGMAMVTTGLRHFKH